nr:flagellar FliJ family protein [uncultured Agathobaculum sp.]
MKKFRFSMETVLHYREQLLDSLRIEHAAAIARVREQEAVLQALQQQFDEVNEEYRDRKQQGMTIADAVGYDLMLRVQEKEIEKATEELRARKRAEEAKRKEVIHAKTDKATIEKLKEKKYQMYQKAVQKSEEQFIDEFVSNARVMAGAAIH